MRELWNYAYLEKFSLNFSSLSFVILAHFSILNHPCSFMVFYFPFIVAQCPSDLSAGQVIENLCMAGLGGFISKSYCTRHSILSTPSLPSGLNTKFYCLGKISGGSAKDYHLILGECKLGSLRTHDGDGECNVDGKMNLCFTYESRITLKSFTSFISAKAITKLNLGHINKSEIKI